MGGQNQATCPPVSKPSTSRNPSPTVPPNPIRFHENTQQGEVHFHDDTAGLKCAVENAAFFSHYHRWRSVMGGKLFLNGHDGKGGWSSVQIIPQIDDNGDMQVEMVVSKGWRESSIGQTLVDLDKLAAYS